MVWQFAFICLIQQSLLAGKSEISTPSQKQRDKIHTRNAQLSRPDLNTSEKIAKSVNSSLSSDSEDDTDGLMGFENVLVRRSPFKSLLLSEPLFHNRLLPHSTPVAEWLI